MLYITTTVVIHPQVYLIQLYVITVFSNLRNSDIFFQYRGRRGRDRMWSYGSCIYNYLCIQYILPLKLYVRIPLMAMCTRYNIM